MRKTWLIVNIDSGSYDASACDRIGDALAASGATCDRVVRIPEDDLPDRALLESRQVDTVAIYTGDGTINALAGALEGWAGDLLVLPGGTLNLLSKQLHGDRTPEAIIADLPVARRVRPPVIRGAGITALVGVILGPTTAWGAVREHVRHFDVTGLVEAVPNAVSETFGDEGVHLAGSDRVYPALNLTPRDGRIAVQGFLADNAVQLLSHGFAWLGGDFRDGPHDDLGQHADVVIAGSQVGEGGEQRIGMLYDGERGEAASGTKFTLDTLDLALLATDTPAT
jgi:hypothetical protein